MANDTDHTGLEQAALAALEADKTHTGLYPAGVWQVVEYGDKQSPGICVHSGDAWRVCFMATIQSKKDYQQQMAKAEHIAAASPAAVLSLIAEVRELRAGKELAERHHEHVGQHYLEADKDRRTLTAQLEE